MPRVVVCFLRDMSAEFAMATIADALPYKHVIVGVGLDTDERGNLPLKFKAVLEGARKEDLCWRCTVILIRKIVLNVSQKL